MFKSVSYYGVFDILNSEVKLLLDEELIFNFTCVKKCQIFGVIAILNTLAKLLEAEQQILILL